MAFQRSYSKVWWGSDNQMPVGGGSGSGSDGSGEASASSSASSFTLPGGSFASGGYYYSFYGQHHQQQHQQQQQQNQSLQSFLQQRQQHLHSGYHSLDYNYKSYGGNLSRIQEVDDEQNISKLSWEKQNSPGSLRSQDSGFSDNDESHSSTSRSLSGRSGKTSRAMATATAAAATTVTTATSSPASKSNLSVRSSDSSPNSDRTIATPPTVVRRVGRSEFYSPLVNVTRRISFSGANKEKKTETDDEAATAAIEGAEGFDLMAELDGMHLMNSPASPSHPVNLGEGETGLATGIMKRRRRLPRKSAKVMGRTGKRRSMLNDCISGEESLSEEADDDDDDHDDKKGEDEFGQRHVPEYNNETVTFGGVLDEEISSSSSSSNTTLQDLSPSKQQQQQPFTPASSTPKAKSKLLHSLAGTRYGSRLLSSTPTLNTSEYENPLLNGHTPALQAWLADLRGQTDHEVMSTLQTKSIAQEAFKNLTITTTTVAKLIRQLQQRAMYMQTDFERMERILAGVQAATLHEALVSADQLTENVAEFTNVLERRAVFFTDSRASRRKYEESIEQIKIITRDTRYSLERHHYISLESLLDDLQVLKRYLLITIRLVFEKMVRVIVQSIENASSDLMLRANINMVATLTNIDYDGFASLTEAFVQNEAVRTLLIVCLEHKSSSVRAQALRALSTICCAPAAIAQLGSCGGIDVLRDVLQPPLGPSEATRRSDAEKREAVSLLTQITASWHGPEHRVDGLRICVEALVEGLTHLVVDCSCSQTLLLSAAALNNLSRMEITAHYSIMSNETISKMIDTVQRQTGDVSIFLYEQIVAMLHNMSMNKKCHSHLANGSNIINFITFAYQTEFHKSYSSRAESDAQRRTIKAILHTLTRLVNDSSLGVELLDQHHQLPTPLLRMASTTSTTSTTSNASISSSGPAGGDHSQLPSLDNCSQHNRDTSSLVRQLLLTQKHEHDKQQRQKHDTAATVGSGGPPPSGEGGQAGAGASNGDDGERKPKESTTSMTSTSAGLKFHLMRHESFV